MVVSIPKDFKPRSYQLKMFQALDGIEGKPETKKKRVFLRWHRRAGKDYCSFAYMVKEAAREKGTYYYFLPNYQQGRKVVWEEHKFLDLIPKELIVQKRDQDMMLRLTNGSVIRVVGTDNFDSIMGTNPIGVVFSEYAMQDPRAWDFIRPIMLENNGWAIFNSTPRGRNHMFELECRVKDHDDWYFSTLQCLYPKKPNYNRDIDQADIQKKIQAERETGADADTIEQEYGVSYTATSKGAIYHDLVETARADNRINYFIVDQDNWVDTFWDLGWNDYTSIWFRQTVGNKIVFINYFEARQKPLAYYIQVLRDLGYRYRYHYLPHDAAQHSMHTGINDKELIEGLCRKAGISDQVEVVPKVSKKQDAINAVRARFSLYHFDRTNCLEAVEKLSLYHRKWDERRRVLLKDPVHDWTSHCADALATEAWSEESDILPQYAYNDKFKVISDYDPLDI